MAYFTFTEDTTKRAEAILRQLTGMSITSAQELLDWCSDFLLDQPVMEWHHQQEN